MRSALVVALAAAAGVSAQAVPTYESTLNMTVDPNTIQPPSRISEMCRAQWDSCELLCDNNTKDNDCENDLSYKCTCNGNSSAPGLQYYAQTMPTLICQELFSQCNAQHVGDSRAQKACEDNIFSKCKDLPAPEAASSDDDEDNEASSSTAASQTTEPTETPAPSDDSGENEENVTTTSSDGFAAPTLAPGGNGVAAIAAIGVLAYLI
ncbi:hypothetical protein HJFPF1_01581 [Paramyrothecium foliicola]|nr:hypothetical protein HJFPF1_01581 [Paramyrothecium foliicola]